MQREMSNLQGQYKLVEQTYGEDVLNLVLAKGYVLKLLANKSVLKYSNSGVQPDGDRRIVHSGGHGDQFHRGNHGQLKDK